MPLLLWSGCTGGCHTRSEEPWPATIGDPCWYDAPSIPQLRRPAAVFDALPPVATELDGDVLVCRVRVHEENLLELPDIDGTPELSLTLRIPGQPRATVHSFRERWWMAASFASTTLQSGDTVAVRIWDTDSFSGGDTVERLQLSFRGSFPAAAATEKAEIECRALTGTALRESFERARVRAEQALGALEADFAPDFDEPDQGFPHDASREVRASIEAAAGHVGWRQPEIRALVEREDASWASWQRRVGERVEAALAELDRSHGTRDASGLTVRGQLQCGRDDVQRLARSLWPAATQQSLEDITNTTGCVAEIEVGSPTTATATGVAYVSADLIGTDGQAHALDPVAVVQKGVSQRYLEVEPGEPVRYVFFLDRAQLEDAGLRGGRQALWFKQGRAPGLFVRVDD